MKLTSVASVISCALSFLAGLAYAGGFARAPTSRPTDLAPASLCDARSVGAVAARRRVEAHDVTLPDGRTARVVMVDDPDWD
jgi:hypothetical protein